MAAYYHISQQPRCSPSAQNRGGRGFSSGGSADVCAMRVECDARCFWPDAPATAWQVGRVRHAVDVEFADRSPHARSAHRCAAASTRACAEGVRSFALLRATKARGSNSPDATLDEVVRSRRACVTKFDARSVTRHLAASADFLPWPPMTVPAQDQRSSRSAIGGFMPPETRLDAWPARASAVPRRDPRCRHRWSVRSWSKAKDSPAERHPRPQRRSSIRRRGLARAQWTQALRDRRLSLVGRQVDGRAGAQQASDSRHGGRAWSSAVPRRLAVRRSPSARGTVNFAADVRLRSPPRTSPMRTASSSSWARTSSRTTASSWRSGGIMEIVERLARLRQAGREIVLVSSGAVGMGMRVLGLKERPRSLGLRQACAAVGQGHLMGLYTAGVRPLGRDRGAGAADAGGSRRSRSRAVPAHDADAPARAGRRSPCSTRTTASASPSWSSTGACSRARAEPAPAGFGDNDGLSARVAVSLDADLLVLLTNVGGLFTANPRVDPDAPRASPSWPASTTRPARAPTAARPAARAAWPASWRRRGWRPSEGTAVLIAGGAEPRVIERALAGEDVGTLITVGGPPARRASATSRSARASAGRWSSTTARCGR